MSEPAGTPLRSDRAPIALWAILLLALALRLVWGSLQPATPQALSALPDQHEYLELAGNLLHRHTLVMTDPHVGDAVYAYRAPGYPLLVALLGASVRWVRIVQALLDTSTALAIYGLARRWLNRRGALMAGIMVAFNPYLIFFSGLILSETLYVSMLAWGTLLLVGWRTSQAARTDVEANSNTHWTLLGASVLALSVLVRPSALGLPVVLAMTAAWVNRGRRGAYPRWWPFGPAGGQVALIALVLLPWAYRNDCVLGHWIWTTTNAGISAYDGFNDQATGASDQRFARHFAVFMPELTNAGEVERDQALGERALGWAGRHPVRSLELAVIKIARTWSPVPLSSEYGRPLNRAIGFLFSVPLDLLVLLGLGGKRINQRAKVLCLLPAIYFTGVHALSVGSLRYRVPAEPLLAVVAAVGWQRMGQRVRVTAPGEGRAKGRDRPSGS